MACEKKKNPKTSPSSPHDVPSMFQKSPHPSKKSQSETQGHTEEVSAICRLSAHTCSLTIDLLIWIIGVLLKLCWNIHLWKMK